MNKTVELLSSVKAFTEDEDLYIEGYANTTTKDRANDIVVAEAWNKKSLENYIKNPIILAFHDHSKPVGKMVDFSIEKDGLKIKAKISKAATEVYNLVKDGILSAFSIGFRILDADYDDKKDIFYIKELELFEVSVVSVPANADSLFSIRKSFKDSQDIKSFISELKQENKMEKTNDINIEEAIATQLQKLRDADAKAEASKAAKEAEKAELVEKATASAVSGAEKLFEDLKTKFEADKETLSDELKSLKEEIASKAEELQAIQKSKMEFHDRKGAGLNSREVEQVVLSSKLLNKSISDTLHLPAFDDLRAKAGAHIDAGVTGDWEKEFQRTMEDEMRQRLVVAPAFGRTINMSSYTLNVPINPEAGTAEWIAPASFRSTDGSSTGTASEHQFKEVILTAHKLVAKEYLGDEEEEDAIIALEPMIRDSLIRRSARSIDIAMLRGDGTTIPMTGVAKVATDASKSTNLAVGTKATVSTLATVRRKLGKYGLNPADIVYVVSNDVYFDLLDDPDFRTIDMVGPQATILTGEVGRVNGSPVLVSGEFEAKAAGKYAAVAMYTPNFLVGNLRGFRVQRDYLLEDQKTVIVASRRTAFSHIIEGEGASVLTWIA